MDVNTTDYIVTKTTDQMEAPDECTRRLSKRLSEYEVTCMETEGRAKQLRKERDVERTRNEKLRKEVDRLSNQLLRERMKVTCLEKEVETFTEMNNNEKQIEEDGDSPDDSTEPPKDPGPEESSTPPTDPNQYENLSLRVQELQRAIEERMESQGNRKHKQDDQEKFIALSILAERLQNYLQVDGEIKQPHKKEPVDFVDSGCTNNNTQIKRNGMSKAQISMWLKIMVYIGPLFLSFLCYIAFTAAKK